MKYPYLSKAQLKKLNDRRYLSTERRWPIPSAKPARTLDKYDEEGQNITHKEYDLPLQYEPNEPKEEQDV